MRYGSPNAGCGPAGGPGVDELSLSFCLGDMAAAALGEGEGADVKGGGSIDEWEVGGFDGMTGSGSAGISSSAEAVSTVICFVSAEAMRKV